MKRMIERRCESTYKLIFLAIFAIGIFVRAWHFGAVPGGLNQDEAFAGYEAWSLLNYGIDSAGYHFPVYLTAWVSGMNALNSYLMMPFIAMFGLEVWVIRLPQLIVACLTLPAVYGVVRRISEGGGIALTAMFLLAICPWHIMLARWGLESNLTPGFLVFGLYFFLRALENERFLMLSAAMYGLSLYCYATVWPFVPLIIVLQCVHAIRMKKFEFNACFVAALLILAVFALPLLLFLAVNYGLIDEVSLPFLSIPKLLYMRSSEISFSHIFENLTNAMKMLITQSDGNPWNCAGIFGQLYPISIIFALAGLVFCITRYAKALKEKTFSAEVFVLIQFFAALLLTALINVNVNRANIIFIPLVMLAAYGIVSIAGLLRQKFARKVVRCAICASYVVFFIFFTAYYFSTYSTQISYYFGEGTGEAVDAALDTTEKIYVSDDIYYPVVLFYSKMPTDEFRASVEYVSYPAAYLEAKSFGRFEFVGNDEEIRRDGVYVLSQYDDKMRFKEAGINVEEYDYAALARP